MSKITLSKKIVNSWCMYDWANSVYNLVICSAIYPIYYESITSIKDADKHIIKDTVTFLGMEFKNTVLSMYALSFSFLIVCILSPILSSIADTRGNKKSFLKFFCYMGAAACAGLYFLEPGTNNEQPALLGWGVFCMIMASVGFWGSLVFYNSFLPDIASHDDMDKISARGFSLGYLGSSTLLILCLVFITIMGKYDYPALLAPRICFLAVAVWWVSFAQILFYNVPEQKIGTKVKASIFKGFHKLRDIYKIAMGSKSMKTFLTSFFFFNMGVQTVMQVAVYFGAKLLGLPKDKLIITILTIQFVGVAGSFLFSYLSKMLGNKLSLSIAILIWSAVCICAWFVAEYKSENGFYVVAFFVGLVMGGIQSLSRATYSKLIPEGAHDTASFFSFYDITEKLAMVIGLFTFAFIEQHSDGMQNSLFAVMIFFILGFLLLIPLKDNRLKAYKQ